MTRRLDIARSFLDGCGWRGASLSPLAGDASFRRYFRVTSAGKQAVLMDAPPEYEDVHPFLAITGLLRARGFSAPEVIAADCAAGFVLLEDLGDDKFTTLLTAGRADEDALYHAAVDLLVALQGKPPPLNIDVAGEEPYAFPPYSMDDLLEEAALFTDWYLPAIGQAPDEAQSAEYLGLWRNLLAEVAGTDDAIVLRDYHADNLIWLTDREADRRVGLLDYQDARRGHAAYDLVSLLQDARRDVAPDLERRAVRRFLKGKKDAEPAFDTEGFLRGYALLGAQRNAKIIGIFTRLSRRDGKHDYLDLIPRVWKLLERDLGHPGLGHIADWFDRHVPPTLRQQAVAVPDAAGGRA